MAVAGHLREQNGIYQMILSYKDEDGKRRTVSMSTHLPVRGNKREAEKLLERAKREFSIVDWKKEMLVSEFLAAWLEQADIDRERHGDFDRLLKTGISPFFDNLRLSIASLSASDLSHFFKDYRMNSVSYDHPMSEELAKMRYFFKAAFDFAVGKDLMETNPVDQLDSVSFDVRILFSDFLIQWLDMMKESIEITTYVGYRSAIHNKIAPYFAEKRYTLQDLERNPWYIQDFYQYQMRVKNVTTNTVIHYHANIRKCLKYAFQIGLIGSNPADRIERPKKNTFSYEYYGVEEMEQLIDVIKGDPLELPILMAAFYGLRRSEVLGLRWSAIDFDQKTITINHTVTDVNIDGHVQRTIRDRTKTQSSLRSLPLVDPIEKKLIETREQQKKDMKLCGECYCRDYLEYIHRDSMGDLIKPDRLTHRFKSILRKNHLKEIRFHDLRHSCASLLYSQGVDLKAIQAWLGHSTIGTTANTYTHFDFSKKIDSANAILDAFGGMKEGCS